MNAERETRTVEYRRSIGQRIKLLRKKRDFTQATLAELVDISVRQVSQIEQGVSFPSLGLLIELARVLRVPPESFLTDAVEDKPDNEAEFLMSTFMALSDESRRALERIASEILHLERSISKQ